MSDPEEVEALRARVAQLEAASGAKAAEPVRDKLSGRTVAGLVALGGLGLLWVLGQQAQNATSPSKPVEPTAVCDTSWARGFYDQARRYRIVRDVDISRERGVVVIVGLRQWMSQDLAAQKTLAAAMDCAIAGPGYLKEVHFRPSLDGRDLMKLSARELLELRESGYARGGDAKPKD